MKKIFNALLLGFALIIVSCGGNKREGEPKVLVFSKTMAFKHASIPAGVAAIQKLGLENGFAVDTTKNAELFTDENLKQYSAVIFLSTTGNILDQNQEAAFERYIQAGGGYVGIHAAADTEYDWRWYNDLAGAQFLSHPRGTPTADFIIKDKNFIATQFFTDSVWNRTDELYNYKNINPDVNVVMTLDESSYEGGENGDFHPIAWYHDFDGGRAFYTGGGHTDESFSEDLFLKHLLGGIEYAIGENLNLDYSKVTSQIPPEADRFAKVTLSEGQFFEPTEMAVLPNGDVLVAQRRGEVMLYNNDTKELSEVLKLDVYSKTLNTPGVNAEEGLMGLQKDPDFANNHWIYLYYAPTGDKWVNRLSRFKYTDGKFDVASEQVIMDVDSQREICCHTGGSIAFGPDGLLYLSTGDNSTPFNEKNQKYVNNGFAPLNDTPGHEQYDARRSSGNTNDLRGKILRIKVKEDGTYDIPEGNLFPVGTEKTRPEIYTMGHRNPYRISVDMKRGYVYWGDVGPDARADSLGTRGPRGYDEMNQAKKAGNFGWPLFIGDNYAYNDYNYETGENGPAFDPAKPMNTSRNNTGLTELPPAMPAYVYYPYDETPTFPQTTTGGRNAMAGPTYYSDMFQGDEKLPSYYDGKVIIYDWMRGWMFAVHLDENGDFSKMEPFAPNVKVNNLIDMEVGPNGKIYLLEYGSGWFSQNANSALGYIEYNGGNRPPLINEVTINETAGKTPLTINASVDASDREDDAIKYLWDFGNGDTKETTEPSVSFTYTDAGAYKLKVTVADDKGAEAISESTSIVAGNSRPEVAISLGGSIPAFYLPGQKIDYEVSVTDPDGTAIDPSNIFVSVDYLEGMDKVAMNMGHQQVSAAVTGKALTQAMDCKTCHKEADASIGPNYKDVAAKYKERRDALAYIQGKIVTGGTGVWGEVTMPAHPNVTSDESRQIALYILSLNGDDKKVKSLPAKGTITAESSAPGNILVITASYTDAGAEGTIPLTGSKSIAIPSNTVKFTESTIADGMQAMSFGGMDMLLLSKPSGWFKLEDSTLKGVNSVSLTAGWQEAPKMYFDFEIHEDTPDGRLIGKGQLPAQVGGTPGTMFTIPITESVSSDGPYYITFKGEEGKDLAQIALTSVIFK
ncbi:ThuA domain-containing protein [Maribacter hydrothermalis]|uniref:Crp/Fnr family transcriptional regulator n=1 Tax=Maribacter hydrothermalis TaxID=1836467 RepID=A0A1B7Z7K1_9FLAO|nr:ThuA domain-containing protein [Maribacter hydrothermalis]APQ15924.1 Crp/Fnr family transcriptional regulator [Maribacter hydrothermalis]OBR38697.1 Crp/Fnr family transcriptional regulator [Maribacter hydrothermalis]